MVLGRVIKEWHKMSVQTKIANMFFKRKYLSALQTHLYQKNYINPLGYRDAILKSKVIKGIRSL